MVFAPYETTPKTIEVTILDDCYAEEDEDFAVYLTGTTGGGASTGRYAALVTIIDNDPVVQIALDVNDNGSLGDAVDGVANFLPGYVGDEQSLTPNREQQVRLIVSGLTPGITVDLELVGTTALPGIACNFNSAEGAYPSSDDDKDFVFGVPPPDAELTPDGQGVTGVMVDGNGRITVPLLVRDFGGRTTVRVLREGNVLGALQVPLDTDGDALPDLWEDRYAAWLPTGFTAFDKRKAQSVEGIADADRDDDVNDTRHAQNPNDPAVRQGKVTGDLLPAFDEYRGFFVGGTHLRTSPIIKTVFLQDDLKDLNVPTKFELAATLGVDLVFVEQDEYLVEKFTADDEERDYRKLNFNGIGQKKLDVIVVKSDAGAFLPNKLGECRVSLTSGAQGWQKRERTIFLNVDELEDNDPLTVQLFRDLPANTAPVPYVFCVDVQDVTGVQWASNGRVRIKSESLSYDTATWAGTNQTRHTESVVVPAASTTLILANKPPEGYKYLYLATGEVVCAAASVLIQSPGGVVQAWDETARTLRVQPGPGADVLPVPPPNQRAYASIFGQDLQLEWISYAEVQRDGNEWVFADVRRGELGSAVLGDIAQRSLKVPYQYCGVRRGQCGTQAMDIPASTLMTPVNVLENVRRAQRGTAAAAHSAGEAVYVWDQPLHMAVAHEFGHALMSEAHQDDEHATGGVMFFQQQRGGPPFYADETRKFLDCVGRYQ